MELVTIGKSDLRVTRVGFGCDQMGLHHWGVTKENELRDAVRAAVDRGINFFDTADVYGLGQSETLLGKFLGDDRKRVVIATKFGVRRDGERTYYDNSAQWLREAVEGSLRRLSVDRIDLYQVHYSDGKTPLPEVFDNLEGLRSEGKIRWYGVTNIDATDACGTTLPPGLVSFSFEYSLAKRQHELRALKMGQECRMGFLTWGTLGQGVLTGKYDAGVTFPENDRRSREIYVNFHGEKLRRNLKIVDEMKRIAAKYPGRSLSQIAIRWILDRFGFSIALVGVKRPDQVLDNADSLDWRLDESDVSALSRVSDETLVNRSGERSGRARPDGKPALVGVDEDFPPVKKH